MCVCARARVRVCECVYHELLYDIKHALESTVKDIKMYVYIGVCVGEIKIKVKAEERDVCVREKSIGRVKKKYLLRRSFT